MRPEKDDHSAQFPTYERVHDIAKEIYRSGIGRECNTDNQASALFRDKQDISRKIRWPRLQSCAAVAGEAEFVFHAAVTSLVCTLRQAVLDPPKHGFRHQDACFHPRASSNISSPGDHSFYCFGKIPGNIAS
jgi:hypothetical protein